MIGMELSGVLISRGLTDAPALVINKPYNLEMNQLR
jgi:hypothetical protein